MFVKYNFKLPGSKKLLTLNIICSDNPLCIIFTLFSHSSRFANLTFWTCGFISMSNIKTWSDHLILASERFHQQMAKLFTARLIHGHQPQDLLLATITSIPKDNQADIYSDSNYRGIALCSSISKIYDIIFLKRNGTELLTH